MLKPANNKNESAPTPDGSASACHAGEPRRCLLVLGMHRSGTSALTRVLSLLGATLPKTILGAGTGNETGHWEPVPLLSYHDALLAELGSRWDDWQAIEDSRLQARRREEVKRDMAGIIAAEFAGAPLIVVKEPRICRFAPLFLEALEEAGIEPHALLALRNPLEVAESLARRDGMSIGSAGLLWLRHMLDAEAATRQRPRMVVSYARLLADWRTTVEEIAAELPFALPYAAEDAASQVEAFLAPGQRHHARTTEDVVLNPMMRDWISTAYEALLVLERNPRSAPALATLDRIRATFDAAAPVIARLLAEAGTAHATAAGELGGRIEELSATLAERDAQIAERDAQVAERDARITERDAQAAERDEQIAGRDAQVAERGVQIAERDALVAAQQAQIAERDGQIAEREALVAAQQAQLAERGATVAERDAQVAEQSLQLAERDQRANTLAFKLKAREGETARLRNEAQLLAAQIKTAVEARDRSERTLQALYQSTSWRYTAPLRALKTRYLGLSEPRVHHPPQANDDAATGCLIVTPPHTRHLAELYAAELGGLGLSTLVAEDLARQSQFQHVFVLCPNVFSGMKDGYIAVQMEQTTDSRWLTPEYLEKLGRASAIVDYSIDNIEYFTKLGFSLSKLFYVPIATADPQARTSAIRTKLKDNLVLFYGDDKIPRRQRLLAKIQESVPVKVVNNTFGREMWDIIERSKVVLNIHYYDKALLEVARICECLSLGTPIVSETALDVETMAEFETAVDFEEVDATEALVAAIRRLLDDEDYYRAKVASCAALARARHGLFARYFRRFLLARDIIGYDAMVEKLPEHVPAIEKGHGLCLTLSETPSRRKAFAAQRQEPFTFVEGLRASPSWVGCALSYKAIHQMMMQRPREKSLLICEDDVAFPPDYQERRRIVDRYLEREADNWDVFSGFMADISPETKVTRVEVYEGVKFVWLDRAVSMVFNIYSRKAMALLARWDEENRDPESNTIDRFMQSARLRVVMAYPFLVEHSEDLASTLWGFANTEYASLVKRSHEVMDALLKGADGQPLAG